MNTRKLYTTKILSCLKKDKLILLVGARQVGKTTILNILDNELTGEKLYLNLEDFFGKAFKSKNDFIDFLNFEYDFDLKQEGYLFLDEVQYLENPESLLKSLYDDKEIKTKIIATGSRFWGEDKLGSSLVGRGEILYIKPFSFIEFLEAKGKNISNLNSLDFFYIEKYLEEYLIYGGYPAVIFEKTKQGKIKQMKRIVDRFFEKDFMYFMKSNDFIDFKRVFQYISLNVGNIFKADKLSQELNISNYKINKFVKFLLDSYLLHKVAPYFRDKSKEYNSTSELYFSDIGFLNYISGNFDFEFNNGKIIENFVFLNLLDMEKQNNIYYYKKKNGSEIDFILEKPYGKIIPIEVKSGNKDNIPVIFKSFLMDYKDKIESFIVTTKNLELTRDLEGVDVFFKKYYLINENNERQH